jgi:hypothetical protein
MDNFPSVADLVDVGPVRIGNPETFPPAIYAPGDYISRNQLNAKIAERTR